MVNNSEFRERLRSQRVLAIVRGHDVEASLQALHTLAEVGIQLAEISLTGFNAFETISRATKELSNRMCIGAGTVLNPTDLNRALAAGANFVVSPCASNAMTEAADIGVARVPGAFSPTEVYSAWSHNPAAVKLFPASSLSPSYISALLDPFPGLHLMPVGGVAIEEIKSWLDAGAIAVGIGSPLLGDAADGGDLEKLAERARQLLHEISRAVGL